MSNPLDAQTLRLLSYEIDMLRATATLCSRYADLPGAESNAFLESFLVHYRILAEFLTKQHKGRCKDQILATDFLYQVPISKTDPISINRTKCDQWVAHLSRFRNPANRPAWPFAVMCNEITQALADLLKKCSYDTSDQQATRQYTKLTSLAIISSPGGTCVTGGV